MIRNACEFALEGDAILSFEEEKLLRSVQETDRGSVSYPARTGAGTGTGARAELEREQEQEPEQAPGQEAEQEQRFGMEMTV
ncbi:MAG: hypothetical protein ACLU3I_08705 [Acutalibacteraceae bacterium]